MRRRDSAGRLRFTDAEWRLVYGRLVVLEVDGGFHMDVEHWSDDIEREREVVATGAIVLAACTLGPSGMPSRVTVHATSDASEWSSCSPRGMPTPSRADDPSDRDV